MQHLLIRIGNHFMKLILRSPLHGLVSENVMIITFTGRKSGKFYTTPVNYVRDAGVLIILSQDDRTWWKNLRGGAPVSVRLQGQDLKGVGEVYEDPEAVAEGLRTLAQRSPSFRKYLQIELTPDGQPRDPNALAGIARDRVIVRITDLKPQ
jgi:deazaflavin-dependent oxidoreductase (nitroreductase family)